MFNKAFVKHIYMSRLWLWNICYDMIYAIECNVCLWNDFRKTYVTWYEVVMIWYVMMIYMMYVMIWYYDIECNVCYNICFS